MNKKNKTIIIVASVCFLTILVFFVIIVSKNITKNNLDGPSYDPVADDAIIEPLSSYVPKTNPALDGPSYDPVVDDAVIEPLPS